MNEGYWHSKTLYHFLLWRREFCFDVEGNFELKKMTPNCNALAKLIIDWVSYYTFVFSWHCKTMLFTNKKHAVTSSERAHSITWYKQKRRRNRWASIQVSRRYTPGNLLWAMRYADSAHRNTVNTFTNAYAYVFIIGNIILHGNIDYILYITWSAEFWNRWIRLFRCYDSCKT